MFQHITKQANALMNAAIPLMAKLDVPPTPSDYGLWYEYVSNTNPKLNKVVDRALRRFGSLPDFVSKELFNEFLLPDEFQQTPRQSKTLNSLTESLTSESGQLSEDIAAFSHQLTTAKKALKFTKEADQLEKLAEFLEHSTINASHAIQQFDQSLTKAQKELTALKAELADLRKSSERDPLTLLNNEKGFERALYSRIPYAEDDLSLLLINIDGLGNINQEYDFKAGTSLIRYMAKLLSNQLPEQASIARLEGGSFAILLCETELSDATKFAESLRLDISNQKIRYKNTKVLLRQVTASIGVATLLGDEGPEALIERARHYLMYAKRSGKNQVAHHEQI
ncbi:GGDEF domain-containing protein [Marinomonas sp. A79]|uniref:diguanylate cyclase n=1 Tax=Marinomonas vulgaris TaxID=2823372 RepID=A0ABS5HAH8_9GAMM|nr:GGDEF domain-containing protein [Marinomonas vulgaris]MBR7888457.1 GGDEF domain-containing protein [Marinomonas vulgaris]